jgi:hypothetical protein
MSLYGLRAELAAGGRDRDVAEALRAGLCGGNFDCRRVELPEQILRGQNQQEIHNSGDDEEVDDGGEEGAVFDLAAMEIEDEAVKAGLANDGTNQGADDVGGKCGDDGAERCANDDGDSQIHHVAAEDEIAKTFDHVSSERDWRE